MSDQNPLEPEQYPDHQHMLSILTEAFQEWVQKQKTPYELESNRGKFTINGTDFLVMQALLRAMVNDNADILDKRLRRDKDEA